MKRFALKITLFAAICLAALSLLFVLPMDKKINFHFIETDCMAHGEWIWERLQRSDDADFLFVGSSHTIRAIDERVLHDAFFKQNRSGKTALNFGYCRLGNNLPYIFFKEFLKTHRPPEALLWEIREAEDRFSHPVFGYLADREDLLANSTVLHPRLLSDWWHATNVRIQNFKVRLGIVPPPPADSVALARKFGYGESPAVADPNFLAQIKAKIGAAARPRPVSVPAFPKFWLEKATRLARENGVRLVFLYLPQFGTPPPDPADPYFQGFPAEVLFPPHSIFSDPANWSDEAHLNDRGARAVSVWLAGRLADF